MAATSKISRNVWVGLTSSICGALESASEFFGQKPSEYARQAIVTRLISDGFMRHPAQASEQTDDAA
jgi:hypothetical protein